MELTANHKKLIEQLADGKFYSAKQLADVLGVSRTSIWNYLKKIEQAGFELHAVKGKGTCFASPVELLDAECIKENIPDESRGLLKEFHVLDVCPSTNQHLLQQNNIKRLHNGSACIAEMQTHGRGRLGRTWVSPYAQNICVSFLWRFKNGVNSLSGLSLACGVAVCDALKKLGVSGHGLKWPNDILWQGKKLGGILVEIQGESQGEYTVIVGIGVNYEMNTQSSTAIDQPWVDISKVHQGELGRNEISSELIGSVLNTLASYEEKGFNAYVDRWNEYDSYKQQSVKIISGSSVNKGTADGVTENGELRLLKASGEIQFIVSGEVSLRLGEA